jgi:hypothetical protein
MISTCVNMCHKVFYFYIVKLKDLRITWLIVFAMINVLWLILIATLADKGKLLGVFGIFR